MADDLELLDSILGDDDTIEILAEDGGVIIRRNGEVLAVEGSLRDAVRAAYSLTAERGEE